MFNRIEVWRQEHPMRAHVAVLAGALVFGTGLFAVGEGAVVGFTNPTVAAGKAFGPPAGDFALKMVEFIVRPPEQLGDLIGRELREAFDNPAMLTAPPETAG